LQKRVRGLEDLEKRLADVERKVEKLSKSEISASAGKTTSAKKS
jgi:tetrahydromethanopterin S-methyltransferase subunit G